LRDGRRGYRRGHRALGHGARLEARGCGPPPNPSGANLGAGIRRVVDPTGLLMRRARSHRALLVFMLAVACTSCADIVGVTEVELDPVTASSSSGTGGALSSGPITGTRVTYQIDPTGIVAQTPTNLVSDHVIEALLPPEGSGSFETFPGTGDSEGNFEIKGV